MVGWRVLSLRRGAFATVGEAILQLAADEDRVDKEIDDIVFDDDVDRGDRLLFVEVGVVGSLAAAACCRFFLARICRSCFGSTSSLSIQDVAICKRNS